MAAAALMMPPAIATASDTHPTTGHPLAQSGTCSLGIRAPKTFSYTYVYLKKDWYTACFLPKPGLHYWPSPGLLHFS